MPRAEDLPDDLFPRLEISALDQDQAVSVSSLPFAVLPGVENIFLGSFGERWVKTILTAAFCSSGRQEPDVFGIDLVATSPTAEKIQLQVKTTGRPLEGEWFSYELEKDHYDVLIQQSSAPTYLVVVGVRRSKPPWIKSHRRLSIVRASARYLKLSGGPPSDNATSVTVRLPASNLFSVESVPSLFER